MILNVILTIFQQGLCYAMVALGVYITYKILDFPDLTVDGAFPLGAVISVQLILGGMNFFLATIIAMLAGGVAGLITGILHVKFKISNLLSGILSMTALASINKAFSNNMSLISYGTETSIRNNAFVSLFASHYELGMIIILAFAVIIIKLLMDLFLKTKTGFMLRAVGNNEQMCTSLGNNSGNYKILGLIIADGLVALGGALYSQTMNYYDSTSGVGMVVLALASVIIGCAMFRKVTFVKGTTAVIIGAIVYTACLNIIILIGVPTTYLKLSMAILFAIILVLNNFVLNKGARKKKNFVLVNGEYVDNDGANSINVNKNFMSAVKEKMDRIKTAIKNKFLK